MDPLPSPRFPKQKGEVWILHLSVPDPFPRTQPVTCLDKGLRDGQGAAPAKAQPAGNPLLAGVVRRAERLPALPRVRRAASPATAAPSGMAAGCQGEGEHGPTLARPGGSYMPPVSPSSNRDSPSSWHSEPQCWHRHLLLLLPGRESRAAGRPPVSCGPAPRAGAGRVGGLCSATKGPRTGSVRKANPCQRAWLVDSCMAPCARCATRPSPRPHVLWKSPGLGAVPLLIHFEASQPRAACQLLGASSLLPERGDFL